MGFVRSDFNYDYGVSFTAEELAPKEAFYNYRIENPGTPSRRAPACSTRTRATTCFTYSACARGIDMLKRSVSLYRLNTQGAGRRGNTTALGGSGTMSTSGNEWAGPRPAPRVKR